MRAKDIVGIGSRLRRDARRIYAWREKGALIAGGFAAGILISYLAANVPEALYYYRARAPIREFARQARRIGLTYDDVLKDPEGAAGKPVEWDVTHPGDPWYYRGDFSMPILWEGAPPEMIVTGQSGMAHGGTIVGTVVKTTAQGVWLRAFSVSSAKVRVDTFKASR